jgi:flagellar basal-body rod protein FlgB
MIDSTTDVLYSALNGLMTQQSAIADNIANVATPGYQAKTVDFESALQSAVAQGNTPAADPSVLGVSSAASNQDGNNVNLGAETTNAATNSLQYQTVIEALNAKFSILRTSIDS